MTTALPLPQPTRPLGIRAHDGALDLYIATGANVTRRELMALAEAFGSVEDEGRYLRLTLDPVYEQAEVVAYFEATYPAYAAEETEA